MSNPFRYMDSSSEVICLTVKMYVRYPLSLRQVKGLLFERGIDICHETVRFWWDRFGPMFAAEIRKRRIEHRRRRDAKKVEEDRQRDRARIVADNGSIDAFVDVLLRRSPPRDSD